MSEPPPPAGDALVFASLPLAVIAYCTTSLGMTYAELLEIAKLAPEQLRDPDELVDYESLIRLWTVMLDRFPDRALGLEYASTLGPRTLGVLGYACTHCRNIGQALALYARFSRLADPHLTVTLEPGEDQVRVALTHEPRVEAMAEPIEMMLAVTAFTARRMNPSMTAPTEVSFRHARRHPAARYREIFDTEVRFEAGWSGAVFDATTLELPIMGADPRIGKYLQQQVEALQQARDTRTPDDPLDARVREAIAQGLMTDAADQAAIARALGMSPRSLQRGLHGLGTSFSEQLEAVRRGRALQLLRRSELSVREIAFMLGYSDPRAFYRSFRRWTGHTPTEYRRGARGAPL